MQAQRSSKLADGRSAGGFGKGLATAAVVAGLYSQI